MKLKHYSLMEREEGEEESFWLLQTFKLPMMICGPGPGPGPLWRENECPQSQGYLFPKCLILTPQ